ncbi:MAG: hypothetical protein KBB14_00130 [Thermoanaerobaculia bacterium]|nr:hypothetical protein [Thermoanaerobaculia bacterium]
MRGGLGWLFDRATDGRPGAIVGRIASLEQAARAFSDLWDLSWGSVTGKTVAKRVAS